MSCDVPVRECFEFHIKPHLDKPKPNDSGTGYRALCPAHDDTQHSLGISIGDKARIVWNCFACKNRQRVRLALIRAGVHSGCLPLVATEKEDLLDQLYRLATADTSDHANVRLRMLAALEGYRDLPAGGELDRIAALAGVNRATAYRAKKKAVGASTANPCSYPSKDDHVKSPSSERQTHDHPDVASCDNVA